MVRIHMVGGTSFEVDAEINDVIEAIHNSTKMWWVDFNDRNDNGHRVRRDHIVHIQEVQI